MMACAAVAAAALGGLAPGARAAALTCGQAVRQTQAGLRNAGAPTSRTDWQGVRDDARRFIDGHPWGGSATEALERDVAALDRECAD
ncbi:hypothetical protein SCATT_p02180 (plasmid) [Streptantibioticus cattleyicolor NRRL 8057 = DSM 46488]|uniref:Uncharacterized protein n=1 Tax=Streptantibioticus cattleyicolor (strain ATCC 35852 / DSM 46488 / JCM 4925 / NBRC 14057 / NRRL 8057) TaxID=1003195 RepID=G8XEM9_STREN|nr:hypothetical protein SCATT_p02180 [Streptantibioticus cattleyicolor NRRL 8057 = DSM 46488]